MAEVKKPAKTFILDYHCDEEGCDGRVLPDADQNIAWLSDPPQFPHRCESCGKTYTFHAQYPRFTYEF